MSEKYDLNKMLAEIEDDEKQAPIKQKTLSQNEIKEMLAQKKRKAQKPNDD